MKKKSGYLYEFPGVHYPITSVRFGKRYGKHLHSTLVSTYRFKQILEKDIASSADDVRRPAEHLPQNIRFFVPTAVLIHPREKLLTYLNNDDSLKDFHFLQTRLLSPSSSC